MPVLISMLRGINVSGHNLVKMDALRTLYESLKFTGCRTYIQSGNVIFCARLSDLNSSAARIRSSISRKFDCSPEVILRTSKQLRSAVAKNPFAKRAGIDPSKLLVGFPARNPGAAARARLTTISPVPEEAIFAGRELYVYFPNGVGHAKLSWPVIERVLKVPVTARNWNTVAKLLEMAEKLGSCQA